MMARAAPSRTCGAAPACLAALALSVALSVALAPVPAAATTVKYLEQWVLGFPKSAAELGPRQRRDLVLLAASIERHCLPAPAGGAMLAIQAVQPRGGLHAAGQAIALSRMRNVRSTLERLAPPETLLIDGTVSDRHWQARVDTAGTPMRRPSSDELLIELACDPLP